MSGFFLVTTMCDAVSPAAAFSKAGAVTGSAQLPTGGVANIVAELDEQRLALVAVVLTTGEAVAPGEFCPYFQEEVGGCQPARLQPIVIQGFTKQRGVDQWGIVE